LFPALLTAVGLLAADIPSHEQVAKKYCVACHNSKQPTASLSLEAPNSDQWEKALRRLSGRTMPPAGLPRPDEATYENAVRSLSAKLDRESAAAPNPGRGPTFRRLSRTEYQNAIRDLLAIEVDVKALLPADEASHGFDNITVADLSPTLLERYLSAARKISRLAIGVPLRAPNGDTVTLPPDLTQESHFEGLPVGSRGGLSYAYNFPVDAEYEIVARLARDRNEHVEGLSGPHDVEFSLDGERLQTFRIDLPPPGQDHSLVDQHLKLRLRVPAGLHRVAATFLKKPTPVLETERQPLAAHFNMDRHPRPQPGMYSLSVNGPFGEQRMSETPSRQRIFVCRPRQSSDEEPCARNILASLSRRAFRRPVAEPDYEHALRLYRETRPQGSFENAIEIALRRILVSPHFLFRVEEDPPGLKPGANYTLPPFELASRLSFFLWASIPDEELLRTAENGSLSKPAVLERQARRMLADPRALSLVSNFASQWLYLRNLDSAAPDMRTFTDFDDNLRQAFRQETELFLGHLLRTDRSVLEMIRADYTFLNQRLAEHYRIPRVYGSRFRQVELPPGSHRGGLLRHGSIHTVTSYPNRTSPVIRGKWILANILGIPPPPPPPNVPALKENAAAGKPRSIRERLSEHRKNPACSGCHQLMDPVGFALENYDGVGRWREVEVPDSNLAVDSAGALPNGARFDGVAGLEDAILARPEMFVTTLTEKLLTYALGRGIETSDAPAVRQILRQAAPVKFTFSSIILGIVQSPPFGMRRTQ
jgi:hypothetical protein